MTRHTVPMARPFTQLVQAALLCIAFCAPAASAQQLDFNRDIQPILSENCYFCHGPDKAQRKADLRLDKPEEAKRDLGDGRRAIVQGKSAESEMIRRMLTSDPDDKMPPADSHREVTPAQIETLKKWIDQGAVWGVHWSFVPPARPALPSVKDTKWVGNPIDTFILSHLEKQILHPSPEASREKLIRRVTFDLTGLPPTPEEVDAFVADKSADAYEKLVDRLLASPKYGERMVVDWLDAARYADTNGYQGDPTRTSWPWRDWAIEAMNSNMPFDQFVTEQLAGDLLPNSTQKQQLATAFNRNHTFNGEGGRIPDETRVENVMDRTETVGTVFLGLTVGCTRCHDHKYDPLTQEEYFKLYAFFNNSSETGGFQYVSGGNVKPVMSITTPEQDSRLAQLQAETSAARAKLKAALPQIDAGQAEWEKSALSAGPLAWTVIKPVDMSTGSGAKLSYINDDSAIAEGTLATTDTYEVTLKSTETAITGIKLEALGHPSLPAGGPGRATNGNFVLTGIEGEAVSTKDANQRKPLAFRVGAAFADFSQPGFDVNGAIDADSKTGWAIMGSPSKDIAATLPFIEPIQFEGGTTIRLKLRQHYGGDNAGGAPGQHQLGRFRLSLTSGPILPADVTTALAVAADKRNDAQKKTITNHYRNNVSTIYRPLNDAAEVAKKAGTDFEAGLVKVMVMDDAVPRETKILARGAYDKPAGEKLAPGTPAVLNKFSPEAPQNRLGLAKWLIDPANPLLARVTVNRYWQSFFGTGLVKTTEDFGLQGEKPTHPELLDWLAVEFRDNGWNVKAIHRLIVTSNTYRQLSKLSPELIEKDPVNRWLARGPRYRLSSFMIRDQALAMSGLLVDKMGGAPVKPYQPAGVWEEMSLDQIKYTPDKGEALYRRSLYTFWRRTVAPTTFFDVPTRTVCSVRQVRTNTPLQALALLNDTTYVEAARILAEKLLLDANQNDAQRLERIFRLATSRKPTDAERQVMGASLVRLRSQYAKDADGAAKLLSVGEKPRDPKLAVDELAAWTTVASMVLNLDEAITQE
jgi:mono/diheme cytochrome c family protein